MNMPGSLKGRPINGGAKAVTQGASMLLEKILKPLVPNLKSYIKDEWDFIRKFPRHFSSPSIPISCDITSLYTSIPHVLGMAALEYWISKLSNLIPIRFTKEFILEFMNFIPDIKYIM